MFDITLTTFEQRSLEFAIQREKEWLLNKPKEEEEEEEEAGEAPAAEGGAAAEGGEDAE